MNEQAIKPEPDAVLNAWSRLLGVHARALKAIDTALKHADLPPMAWYDVLLELDRAGGRCRIGELAGNLVIEPYNMTRLLDRLESAGLLRRERAPADRRGAYAVLTRKGEALRRKMWPRYRRLILDIFGSTLTQEDARALDGILTRIANDLRRD